MHAHVLYVVLIHLLVGLCSQTGETILVEEYPERIHTKHQDIDPEVKLQALDQEGLVKILLDDAMLAQLDVGRRIHGQEDPTALARGLRFNYENWSL